jgi:hypothetical protein
MCIYSMGHVCSETHMAMVRYGGGMMCGCWCASITPVLTLTLRVHGSTLRQNQSGEIEDIMYGTWECEVWVMRVMCVYTCDALWAWRLLAVVMTHIRWYKSFKYIYNNNRYYKYGYRGVECTIYMGGACVLTLRVVRPSLPLSYPHMLPIHSYIP